MRIVLLGAPGSGKGTQGKLLSSKHRIPQISTGDLLRAAVSAGTALGRQAKAAMDAGQLVSDEIVLGIIGERLGERDAAKGFILDGFPRNIAQAEALDTMLIERGTPLQAAVLINVEVEALIERLTGRRTCESCGQMYNIYTSPPRLDDRCDKCGGNLRHRADDNEETISNRLRVYDQQTSPLIAYYRAQDKLKTVKGEGDIAGIFAEIEKLLRKLPSGAPAAARAADTASSTEEKPSLEDLRKKVMAAAAKTTGKEQSTAPKPVPVKKPAAQPSAVKDEARPAVTKPAVTKKPAVKKAVVKKAAAKKKSATKKPAIKKTAAVKKGGTKKAVIKRKATPKKAAAKKTPVKKAAVKKAAVKKKPAVKKAVGKKKAMGKKKVAVKKAPAKKGPPKKAPAKKKVVAKKAPAKKGAVKKAAAKKKRR